MQLIPTPLRAEEEHRDLGEGLCLPFRLGYPRQGCASFLRLPGTLIPFPKRQPPLYTPSPPLTCLPRQDPLVEPMFTWGRGEEPLVYPGGVSCPASTVRVPSGQVHFIA